MRHSKPQKSPTSCYERKLGHYRNGFHAQLFLASHLCVKKSTKELLYLYVIVVYTVHYRFSYVQHAPLTVGLHTWLPNFCNGAFAEVDIAYIQERFAHKTNKVCSYVSWYVQQLTYKVIYWCVKWGETTSSWMHFPFPQHLQEMVIANFVKNIQQIVTFCSKEPKEWTSIIIPTTKCSISYKEQNLHHFCWMKYKSHWKLRKSYNTEDGKVCEEYKRRQWRE